MILRAYRRTEGTCGVSTEILVGFVFPLFTCDGFWKWFCDTAALPSWAVAGSEMSGLNGKISKLRL